MRATKDLKNSRCNIELTTHERIIIIINNSMEKRVNRLFKEDVVASAYFGLRKCGLVQYQDERKRQKRVVCVAGA